MVWCEFPTGDAGFVESHFLLAFRIMFCVSRLKAAFSFSSRDSLRFIAPRLNSRLCADGFIPDHPLTVRALRLVVVSSLLAPAE